MNLVAGLLFLILAIVLMAVPAHYFLAKGQLEGLGPWWVPVLVGSGILLGALAVAIPLRAGARNLRTMEF